VIFLAENDREVRCGAIDEVLATRLPAKFHGYSTKFTEPVAHTHSEAPQRRSSEVDISD